MLEAELLYRTPMLALSTQTPLVPCAIVGTEEISPVIGDIKLLARLFGVPHFPATPLFPLLGPLGNDSATSQVVYRVR